jgi:uncharacterized protein with HEPN domain
MAKTKYRHNVKQCLSDMLTNIEKAREYLGTMTFDDFLEDEKTFDAVRVRLQDASEAARRLNESDPAEMKAIESRNPELGKIGWERFRGISSVSRHWYDIMDPVLLWEEFEPNGKATKVEAAMKQELVLSQVKPIESEPETKQEQREADIKCGAASPKTSWKL